MSMMNCPEISAYVDGLGDCSSVSLFFLGGVITAINSMCQPESRSQGMDRGGQCPPRLPSTLKANTPEGCFLPSSVPILDSHPVSSCC